MHQRHLLLWLNIELIHKIIIALIVGDLQIDHVFILILLNWSSHHFLLILSPCRLGSLFLNALRLSFQSGHTLLVLDRNWLTTIKGVCFGDLRPVDVVHRHLLANEGAFILKLGSSWRLYSVCTRFIHLIFLLEISVHWIHNEFGCNIIII